MRDLKNNSTQLIVLPTATFSPDGISYGDIDMDRVGRKLMFIFNVGSVGIGGNISLAIWQADTPYSSVPESADDVLVVDTITEAGGFIADVKVSKRYIVVAVQEAVDSCVFGAIALSYNERYIPGVNVVVLPPL